MTALTAFAVRWYARQPNDHHRELVLRFLGRIPDSRDVAEAEHVLAEKRAAG